MSFLEETHPYYLYYVSRRDEILRATRAANAVTAATSSASSSGEKIKCPYCRNSTNDAANLESHLEGKSEREGHPRYSWEEYLRREEERGKFPCPWCYLSLSTASS